MSYAYVTILAGDLICFVAGTAFTWSSPEIPKLENDTSIDPVSDEAGSWISSILLLGEVFGPFLFGFLADRIGRRYTLLSFAVPFLLSYVAMAFGKVLIIFYLVRFISGMAIGGICTVFPIYVGEIADHNNRGALGTSMNVFIRSGMLFSFCVGPYVNVLTFNLVLAIFPVIFFVLFFFLGSECPQYYIVKENVELAKSCLQKIRGNEVNVEPELFLMQQKIRDQGRGNVVDIFRSKGLRKAFIMSFGLLAIQQLTGINAILLYAQTIFKESKSSIDPAVCSIIIGAVMFGISFLPPLLVDKLGRKILLLSSAIGMILSEVSLGLYSYMHDNGYNVSSVSFLPLVCLIAFIITYNCGFGTLPWVILGELFPTNLKSIASSIAAGICMFLSFLLTKYFAAISKSIGMGPSFWIYSGVCACAVPFTLLFVIETKGKSLDQIQDELNR